MEMGPAQYAAWHGKDFSLKINEDRGYQKINVLLCFSLPTDVQAEAIPLILGGGDVLMVGYNIQL